MQIVSLLEFLLPLFAGLVVGFLIGLTGMGGGALMTPFLIIFMKLEPVLAVGTDLAFAAITKITGGIKHRREKNVSLRYVGWIALGSIPASFLSAQFILQQTHNRHLVENTLPNILGFTLIIVSLVIFARVFRILGPKEKIEIIWPSPVALIIIGAIGGALVGMTSIGGGTVMMALFLIFFSIPLRLLVGIDVVHGAVLAVLTAFSYSIAGQVDWNLVLLLICGSIPGVWFGAMLINKVNTRLVRGFLALLILLAGIDLLFLQS